MNDHWVLIGKVVGGVKQAAYFTQLDWVQEQCADKLGFRPYPGTLNLEISKESLPELEDLRLWAGIELVPPDPAFCAAKTLPLTIEGVAGAMIVPSEDVNVHKKNVVEILAPLRLKDALNLGDGSTVTVMIKKPGASGVSCQN